MQHFFAEKKDIIQGDDAISRIRFTGDDYNHMVNVLRLRKGEEISVRLTDDPGKEYRFGVDCEEGKSLICTLRFIKEDNVELPAKVYLFQGLPKSDKLELIIQKCVELGVYEIIPVTCARSIVRIDEKKQDRKTERLNAISEAAAKQAGRGIIPEVLSPVSFDKALLYADSRQIKHRFIPYELSGSGSGETRDLMEKLRGCIMGDRGGEKSIAVFIGPEGGFEKEEVEEAKDHGFLPISLGKRILRTETASITFMSWLTLLLEDI